ncbi:hypothetical protein CDAR_438361 [Caerostris darwini]|uniref:Uncharacterized protein n=1 Tax=Caerostris darwini TaxID=1538125 RepID=A0AAV4X1N6_9ARAC|nr:hypothetical protein CDAR_438361 [Caerostris darwini]
MRGMCEIGILASYPINQRTSPGTSVRGSPLYSALSRQFPNAIDRACLQKVLIDHYRTGLQRRVTEFVTFK